MFPLEFHRFQNTSFDGPGLVRFDFKECAFDPKFYTFNDSRECLEDVLDSLKKSGLLSRGAYKWYDHHFGPIVMEHIHAEDFVKISGDQLLDTLYQFVDSSLEVYSEEKYENGELDIAKHKIRTALAFVPTDQVLFFKYAIKIEKENFGSTKLVDLNIFDYFYFIIGYNETRFYLMTVFYE